MAVQQILNSVSCHVECWNWPFKNIVKQKQRLALFCSSSCSLLSPGWGGTPLYQLYRYVPPFSVWFLSHFGLKMDIDFDHYGLKSSTVFKGTTRAYKRMCFQLQMNKREKNNENKSLELNFNICCWRSNLSDSDIIKWNKMACFGLK